jgi:hypothetical protein
MRCRLLIDLSKGWMEFTSGCIANIARFSLLTYSLILFLPSSLLFPTFIPTSIPTLNPSFNSSFHHSLFHPFIPSFLPSFHYASFYCASTFYYTSFLLSFRLLLLTTPSDYSAVPSDNSLRLFRLFLPTIPSYCSYYSSDYSYHPFYYTFDDTFYYTEDSLEVVLGASGSTAEDGMMILRVPGAEAHAKGSQHKRGEDWSFEEYFMYLVGMEKEGWPENGEDESVVLFNKLNWQIFQEMLAEAGQPLDSDDDMAAAFVLLQELVEEQQERESKSESAKGECNYSCRLLATVATVEVTERNNFY